MIAREYQTRAETAVAERFDAGDQRTLVVLPTGGGKTVVAGFVARRRMEMNPGKRVMVLAHRDELLRQAAKKFATITGVMPEIEKADERTNERNMHGKPPVVVGSFQTLASQKRHRRTGKTRIEKFDPDDFCLVWVDEAHHILADSYRRVVSYFAQNPNCKVLGVTATPDRGDGESLGSFFQSVAFDYELPDIINDGYLVPIHQYSVPIEGMDFSRIHTLAGDLNSNELEQVMLFEAPLHGVAHATIEVACGLERGTCKKFAELIDRCELLNETIGDRHRKQTLIFTAGVKQAERTAEILNRWIPGSARHVDGGFPPEERARLFRDYANGRFQFLVNCMIATEGFDEPGVELVVMARPTKSRALYSQMIGRGTRPANSIANKLGFLPTAEERRAMIAHSEKAYCQVLDFVGNSGRHRLVTMTDILGARCDDDVIEAARVMSEEGDIDVQEALVLAAEEVQLKKRMAEEAAKRKHEAEQQRLRDEADRRAYLIATGQYDLESVDGFDTSGVRVDRMPAVNKWQLQTLERAKIPDDVIAKLNPQQAKDLVAEIRRRWKNKLCSWKQAALLKRAGYTKNELHDMSFTDASAAITAVKQNGWKRPAGQQLVGATNGAI